MTRSTADRQAVARALARQLRIEWFGPEDVVLVTAGASCPEVVVEKGVATLASHFCAAVENRVVREENVRFALPRVLI